jgi:hypothetical protein
MKSVHLSGMIWVRLAIVSLGLLVTSIGLYAWMRGNFWFTVFNPRFGQFGTGPTLMFVFFGLLIVLFGLFSNGWEAISPEEEKSLSQKRRKNRRYWKR